MAELKVLLVEDERDIAFVLRSGFKKEGIQLLTARTGESGLKMARKHKPDFIILDIMLPQMDGLEMIRILRAESQVPVLFLSARNSEIDRVLGFKLGADDYLTKPFSMSELIARVRAILSRTNRRSPVNRQRKLIHCGDIEADLDRHEVRVLGKYRNLTPTEFQLLALLLEADGKVLSRDDLLKHIWGYDADMEIDTRTVDQHIARLRRKLRSEKQRIVTVKKFGYRIQDRPR